MKAWWVRTLARCRLEWRDLVELALAPGLAAVLPWPWCFRLFKRMAQWPFLYREPCERALAQALQRGAVANERDWLAERRLVTLVDHADFYLSRTRTDAWLRRHITVQGAWQAAGERALLMTFHWGCGMWALRHAAAAGLHGHPISAPVDGAAFAGRRVLGWYAKARMNEVARALGRPIAYLPGIMPAVLGAMGRGEQVIAVMDVPPDQAGVTRPLHLLGQTVHVPALLPRLAVRRGWPVTVYTLGLDVETGQRPLRIHPLGVWQDEAALSARIFGYFEELVQQQPAAWHFWSEAERFFQQPPEA